MNMENCINVGPAISDIISVFWDITVSQNIKIMGKFPGANIENKQLVRMINYGTPV